MIDPTNEWACTCSGRVGDNPTCRLHGEFRAPDMRLFERTLWEGMARRATFPLSAPLPRRTTFAELRAVADRHPLIQLLRYVGHVARGEADPPNIIRGEN